MHSVTLAAEARRFYQAADAVLQRKLDRCFEVLKHTPRRHPNIKALKGRLAGLYRYRLGDYRVVYRIDDAVATVTVVTIAHRSRSVRLTPTRPVAESLHLQHQPLKGK